MPMDMNQQGPQGQALPNEEQSGAQGVQALVQGVNQGLMKLSEIMNQGQASPQQIQKIDDLIQDYQELIMELSGQKAPEEEGGEENESENMPAEGGMTSVEAGGRKAKMVM